MTQRKMKEKYVWSYSPYDSLNNLIEIGKEIQHQYPEVTFDTIRFDDGGVYAEVWETDEEMKRRLRDEKYEEIRDRETYERLKKKFEGI